MMNHLFRILLLNDVKNIPDIKVRFSGQVTNRISGTGFRMFLPTQYKSTNLFSAALDIQHISIKLQTNTNSVSYSSEDKL